MRMVRKRLVLLITLLNIVLVLSAQGDSGIPGFSAKDKAEIKKILEGRESVNWVFTGNSITQGAKHTHGMRSFPEIFAERIRWEMHRTSDFIINTAFSGNTTEDIIKNFDHRVSRFNPRVVVLMIGTNDAAVSKNISVEQYGKNLVTLINDIRKIGAVPILMTPTPIIEEKAPERASISRYIAEMRRIAAHSHVILVDHWKVWNFDLREKYKDGVYKKLLNDPLHPNGYGHLEIAWLLFKELSIFDPLEATCNGDYYEGEH